MSTSTADRLYTLARILGGDPSYEVAKRILLELEKLPPEQARYLSYNQIAAFGDVRPEDGRLLQSLAILSAEKLDVLHPFYVYLADDGVEYRLKPEDLKSIAEDGVVIDPHSGDAVRDYSRRLFPYYECGSFK